MPKQPQSAEPPEPHLTQTATDAAAAINARIDLGKAIKDRDIGSRDALDLVQRDYFTWSEYNSTLLRKLFSNAKLSDEYSNSIGFISMGRSTLAEDLREFRGDVETKIRRLVSIRERLPLFEGPGGKPLKTAPAQSVDPRSVFVVHGRNTRLNAAMFAFLRSLDLRPLEWEHLISRTGQPNPYVGEILKVGFAEATAAVVLLTGDDEARLREPLRNPSDPPFESVLTPQARPNVLLEAGMALGLYESRTVIVQCGEVRSMSDILGRHILRLSNSPESRKDFAQRLTTATCAVSTAGSHWLTTGDFSVEVSDAGVHNSKQSQPSPGQPGAAGGLSENEERIVVILAEAGEAGHTKTRLATLTGLKPLIVGHLVGALEDRKIVRGHYNMLNKKIETPYSLTREGVALAIMLGA